MDIKNVDKHIFFDLVKRWVSDTLHRTVEDTVPEGCPWQSISLAFSTALECFKNKSPADVEDELRKYLAITYWRMDEQQKTALYNAKLEDETSIFRLGYYPNIETIREHWKWYTYCLLHPSRDFTQGREFRQPPDPCVVRLPLDFVDLQMLSNKYQVRINVFRYSDEIRFTPGGVADRDDWPRVHLVHHRGLWAVVRGPREARGRVLETSLVELDNLPDAFQHFSRRAVCLAGYNEDERCYRALAGQQVLQIDRLSISRVIQAEDPGAGPPSSWKLRYGGSSTAPSLVGIPDRAFEFQLLLEYVREELTDRLRRMRSMKKGEAYTGIDTYGTYLTMLTEYKPLTAGALARCKARAHAAPCHPAPQPQTWPTSCYPSQRNLCREHLGSVIQRLEQMKHNEEWIYVLCPDNFSYPNMRDMLSFSEGDFIAIHPRMQVHNLGYPTHFLMGHRLVDPKSAPQRGITQLAQNGKGWVHTDVLCVWENQQSMLVPFGHEQVCVQKGSREFSFTFNERRGIDGQVHATLHMAKKRDRRKIILNTGEHPMEPFLMVYNDLT